MESVMRHDYLRKSMEQRLKNKRLIKEFKYSKNQKVKDMAYKDTRAQVLRSQSVLDNLHQLSNMDRSSSFSKLTKSQARMESNHSANRVRVY